MPTTSALIRQSQETIMKRTGIVMAAACAVTLAAVPVLAQQYDKSTGSATPKMHQPGGEGTGAGTGTGTSTGGGTGMSAGASGATGATGGTAAGTSKSGAPAGGTLMQKREKGMSHGASDATGKTTQ
jgi:hypothetical protein